MRRRPCGRLQTESSSQRRVSRILFRGMFAKQSSVKSVKIVVTSILFGLIDLREWVTLLNLCRFFLTTTEQKLEQQQEQ